MLKRVLAIMIAVMLILSVVGCTAFMNTTQKYLKAFSNTNKADTLQSRTEYKINLDLSKATGDIKSDLEKFKEITINVDEWVDNKNEKSQTDAFLKAGDIMVDSRTYVKGDNAYIKSSLTGEKYIHINAKEMEAQAEKEPEQKYYEEEGKKLFDEIAGVWKNAVANELLVSEGNSIVNTPDGDIKVTQLSLKLTDAKSKNILGKLADTVSKNKFLQDQFIQGANENAPKEVSRAEMKSEIKKWFKDLPQNMEKAKDKYSLEKLKLTAKIDKDSYIIDQTIEGTLVIRHEGEIRIEFSSHTTRWNINSSDVKVTIPEISQEDISNSDIADEDFWKDFDFFKK